MKKRILSIICLIIFLSCIFLFKEEEIKALEGFYEISLGEALFIKNSTAYVDIKGLKLTTKIKVEITDVTCYDSEGNIVDSTIDVRYGEEGESSYREYYVKSGGALEFTCYCDADLPESFIIFTDSAKFTLNMKVKKISEAKLRIDCHKSITMKDTGMKAVYPKVYLGGEDVSEYVDYKIKASKKNLIDIEYDDIDEYFYLSGNYNSGKCKITVTAKYKGQTCSDTFSLKVKSTLKKKLYVLGELYSYNTRSNTFKMSVFNRSKKKIIIYSKNAVALDDDYVSFDRNVKLAGNKKRIIIKPNQSKDIKWKVIGSTTWYRSDDFEIHFKCKYKGKSHWLSIQEEEVYVLKKKKWKRMS